MQASFRESSLIEILQTLKAVEKGLHVLCEKPLSTDLDEAQGVVDAAAKRPYVKRRIKMLPEPHGRLRLKLKDKVQSQRRPAIAPQTVSLCLRSCLLVRRGQVSVTP